MTSPARVVRVQPSRRVKPEQPAEVGQVSIDAPAETLLERGLDGPGEARPDERRAHLVVERRRRYGAGAGNGQHRREDCDRQPPYLVHDPPRVGLAILYDSRSRKVK